MKSGNSIGMDQEHQDGGSMNNKNPWKTINKLCEERLTWYYCPLRSFWFATETKYYVVGSLAGLTFSSRIPTEYKKVWFRLVSFGLTSVFKSQQSKSSLQHSLNLFLVVFFALYSFLAFNFVARTSHQFPKTLIPPNEKRSNKKNSKIDQVKGYVSKVEQLHWIIDRFFKLTSSFDRFFKLRCRKEKNLRIRASSAKVRQAYVLWILVRWPTFLTHNRPAMPFGNRKKIF